MTVRLERINKTNWEAAADIQVSVDQKGFVASNLYSIAEASFYPETIIACAVYDNETMVGFVMYGYDDEEMVGWSIIRLMTDQRFQRKGYGRSTMLAVINDLKQKPDCKTIYISFVPDNHVARALYASLGFVDDDRIVDGEVVYRLDLV